LPSKIINTIIELSRIDATKKVNSITKEERANLVYVLQNLEMDVKKLRNIDEAIITRGGISTKEIDPSTMQSKLVENLYFAGEIIDVDAFTGGFNLQIAFSTGYLAGINLQ
jgi:predicted Rossmann fold flavoprotein